MMQAPIDWLLEGEPWIEYRTRLDLLGQSEGEPQVAVGTSRACWQTRGCKALLAELSRLAGDGHLQP